MTEEIKKNNSPDNAPDEEKKTGLKDESLPIDARLLSEAVIEFNISRRSVGLYPPGHIQITGSIDKALGYLKKLFELRNSIMLGITKDSIVIDNRTLDGRNPVYRECANSFHVLGIASITFHSGVERQELVALNEMMTLQEPPQGEKFVEMARERGINNIQITPINYDNFAFLEGKLRATGGKGGKGGRDTVKSAQKDIWEDYIFGLLEGKLAGGASKDEAVIAGIPPDLIAEFLNKDMDLNRKERSYDSVVASYISGDVQQKLSPKALKKLVEIMEKLTPEIREQFLSSAINMTLNNLSEVEAVLSDLNSNDLGQIVRFFTQNSSRIPSTLKNIIDKFSAMRQEDFKFDILTENSSVVHDIELTDDMAHMFNEDNFLKYVSSDYKHELDIMLFGNVSKSMKKIEELASQCKEDVIERVTSDIMVELMDFEHMEQQEFLSLMTNMSRLADEFIITGRFEETLNVFNSIYGYAFNGRFSHEARGTIDYFFKAEPFIQKLLEAVLIYGRTNREGAARLVRAFREQAIIPLFDLLEAEQNATNRKFTLLLLMEIGRDILPEAMKRLKDKPWFVVRNMLLLIGKAGTAVEAEKIRPFAKHDDPRVWTEAIKVLLAFKNKYAVPYLKYYLKSEHQDVRERAVKIAGSYKVRDAVPQLLEIIEKKDILGSESFYKVSAIVALGEIADPRALETLEKVLSSTALLFRGYHEDMKIEIYKSLVKYPPKDALPIVEGGMRSSNRKIASICESIYQRMKPEGGQ